MRAGFVVIYALCAWFTPVHSKVRVERVPLILVDPVTLRPVQVGGGDSVKTSSVALQVVIGFPAESRTERVKELFPAFVKVWLFFELSDPLEICAFVRVISVPNPVELLVIFPVAPCGISYEFQSKLSFAPGMF